MGYETWKFVYDAICDGFQVSRIHSSIGCGLLFSCLSQEKIWFLKSPSLVILVRFISYGLKLPLVHFHVRNKMNPLGAFNLLHVEISDLKKKSGCLGGLVS